jgi:hypothetical protein
MLATLESQFGARPDGAGYWVRWAPAPGEIGEPALILLDKERMAEFYIHGHWQHADRRAGVELRGKRGTVQAFVNDSRWLVQCPNATCNSAQLASKVDRRFFCVSCLNADNGGHWLNVEWPKDHQAIEEVLLQRPNPSTRHWMPGETVKDLERENAEHNV